MHDHPSSPPPTSPEFRAVSAAPPRSSHRAGATEPFERRPDRTARTSGLLAMLAGAALISLGALPGAAAAEDNPIAYDGNVTTCAEIGLEDAVQVDGEITDGEYETDYFDYVISGDNTTIDIVSVDPDWEVVAVVVKGGDAYHVYSPPLEGMVAPLNDGGNTPEISHWHACLRGAESAPPTSEEVTTTTMLTTTTGGGGAMPPTTGGLPSTGSGTTSSMVLAGLFLVGLGGLVTAVARGARRPLS